MSISKLLKDLSESFLDPDNEILIEAEESNNHELLLLIAQTFADIAGTLTGAAKRSADLESSVDTEGLEQVASFATEIEKHSGLDSYAEVLDNLLLVLAKDPSEKEENLPTNFKDFIKELPLEELYRLKREKERKYNSIYNRFDFHLNSNDVNFEEKKRRIDRVENRLAELELEVYDIMHLIESKENQTLEGSVALANALDNSQDEELTKLASVLDEILLTIGANKKYQENFKLAEDAEIEKLRKKYREEASNKAYSAAKIEQDKQNQVEESSKIIDEKVKVYRPMQHPLSTRYSPDMPGVSLMRIGENVYQCPVTKKIYNFEEGYTKMNGDQVPGTSVTNQTQQIGSQPLEHVNFSTREELLNSY